MEITEQQFRTQLSEARNIETVKLKEWSDRLKQLLPVYVIEYLFHRKSGVVVDMLQIDENVGFVYDPATLKQGVDMLVKIAEGQTLTRCNPLVRLLPYRVPQSSACRSGVGCRLCEYLRYGWPFIYR